MTTAYNSMGKSHKLHIKLKKKNQTEIEFVLCDKILKQEELINDS